MESRGFNYQPYEVTTEDGYILKIFRIINPFISRAKLYRKPVLMWHGVLDNAETFIRTRPGGFHTNGIYTELIDNKTIANDCLNKWETII